MIHWHGLTPPWRMDGVPDNPMPLISRLKPCATSFPSAPAGALMMPTLAGAEPLAAPLIVRTAADRERDEQEVVILLHDFSSPRPRNCSRASRAARGAEQAAPPPQRGGGMAGMDHSAMGGGNMGNMSMPGMPSMQMGGMDLNDIDYDAYLANDRTLDDPEVVRVENRGRVRLRIINGATATAFTIDTGAVRGTLVAVDGQPVRPIVDTKFPISMGQRLDITLELPRGERAFPILALREGAVERTGVVLATTGATVQRSRRLAASSGQSSEMRSSADFEGSILPCVRRSTYPDHAHRADAELCLGHGRCGKYACPPRRAHRDRDAQLVNDEPPDAPARPPLPGHRRQWRRNRWPCATVLVPPAKRSRSCSTRRQHRTMAAALPSPVSHGGGHDGVRGL